MKTQFFPMLLVASLSILLPNTEVFAKKSEQEMVRDAVRRGEILPLKQILELVNAEFDGDIIEIELDEDDDEWVYEIKVLTPQNRILEIEIDARKGRILDVDHK
ncbi:PepSY domain-containing protein [Thorsellia anophelis]|uniref:Peptidase propeptide and YPEB domain-containing protein n=1 Tax=Thorsellia anophelis DSM 18579 TaxID=1123402 RepID=A0A1I0B9A0_9GAMM|nr:PepSY domain-containing protein [Thorsellia anophelis]SET03365.1 Peptidase propeptide and YPEB domain-containing protein [Thorsellia anophelis DSM 18579]